MTTPTRLLLLVLLRTMAAQFNIRPSIRDHLRSAEGWIDFTIGFRTRDRSVAAALSFSGGKALALATIPDDATVTMVFRTAGVLLEMLRLPPNEVLNLLMRNRMCVSGNLSYLNLFSYLLSVLMHDGHRRLEAKRRAREREEVAAALSSSRHVPVGGAEARRRAVRLKPKAEDPGVAFLEDPYLSGFSLSDFPRLKAFLDAHFRLKPEICAERPRLLTQWYREHGFETDREGRPWNPALRQAHAFKHLMAHKEPRIRYNDLVAVTTTAKEVGVVIYPDAHGTTIWGELISTPERALNPYDISPETRHILHHDVFPFWARRNFREWVRDRFQEPLCQQLDERFAVYFLWKTAALSHTIPDFPRLLRLGTRGIIREIEAAMARDKASLPDGETASSAGVRPDRADGARRTESKEDRPAPGGNPAARGPTLDERNAERRAMILCLEGLEAYAANLSTKAAERAERAHGQQRKAELERLAEICARVPAQPARTLDEAVNAIWIGWIGLHQENTNAGLSLGRLDQWLQPYFAADMQALETQEARRAYVAHAIELIGCLYMRCTDHLPLVPDLGNYLFGGSSSDQAITLGGVTPEGEDAVVDMTYIFLKVTEMLAIRDPNVNARFHPGINSDTYLRRLCEVNLITAATPSMHNDRAVIDSLLPLGYRIEDIRDWSATGCVEPTLSGKQMGHTNSMMMNLVAALEMALNNGRHPLMDWEVGPHTGDVSGEDFPTFDTFFDAFSTQLEFLVDQAVAYNRMLAEAHALIRPTPLLSSLIDGCIGRGLDATEGGARYNSSGAACIGLADVTDSLMAIKRLVYDTRQVRFADLKAAVDGDFEHHPELLALVRNKVPLFGSGSPEALEMARRVARLAHDLYARHENYRGGPYTAGFWSMSNHVAFGTLAGALPSGRRAGKAFTPGLTPEAHASSNLLDNIRDVARLDPRDMNNNIAFNVKVAPAPGESLERIVDNMHAYVRTYFDLGGMQMQMNVASSAMLRDAMLHPENYRNLLVRISGYNAYFVTLNRDMQLELIERAEYGLG